MIIYLSTFTPIVFEIKSEQVYEPLLNDKDKIRLTD